MKKKSEDFIVFGIPNIKKQEINEVIDTLKSGWIGTGPKVKKFENEFIKYKNSKYAVALSSCTSALFLSLKCLNIGKNDEVLVPALTFCSTVNSIIHTGAKPVLVDVERRSMNIDPKLIEKKISKKTKALIIVHFAGLPVNMKEIIKITKKNNIKLIEDCAHSIESKFNKKHLGTFGDFGCFSFYPNKNITTGEGGMIITNKKQHYEKISKLSLHGLSLDAWNRFGKKGYKHYDVDLPGYKFNMTDIQASIGIHQLRRITNNWKIRKKIWNQYYKSLQKFPVILPKKIKKNDKHSFHLFTILIDASKTNISRNAFMSKMNEFGIGVGVHYQAIADLSYYKKELKININDFPNSKFIGRNTVSLPISTKMSIQQIKKVIEAVKRIFDV